jgi:hypothetical protein
MKKPSFFLSAFAQGESNLLALTLYLFTITQMSKHQVMHMLVPHY